MRHAHARDSSRPHQTSPQRLGVGSQLAGSGGLPGCEGRDRRTSLARDSLTDSAYTQLQGLPGPPAARPPLQVTPGASANRHKTTSPGGTDPRGVSGPTRVPTTPLSAVPAPAPSRSGVYTHKQLGGGGDASLSGMGMHTAPPTIPPFTRRTSLSAHICPPTPTLKTPRNRRANTAQMRGSDPGVSFNVNGETSPTQMRGSRDASPRCPQARVRGPKGHQTAAADQPPPPHPPPQAGVQDSHLLAEEPELEPTPLRLGSPAPPRAGFSEPVNLTPAPPADLFPRPRYTAATRIIINKPTQSPLRGMSKAATAMDPPIQFPPLLPSPTPPAARGLTRDGGREQPV